MAVPAKLNEAESVDTVPYLGGEAGPMRLRDSIHLSWGLGTPWGTWAL